MSLAHPVPFALALLAALAVVLFAALRRSASTERDAAPDALRLANADRLGASRTYRRRLAAYRALLVALLAAAATCVVAAAALGARVVSEDAVDPRLRTRDVMLCLDVSTSMADADQQVLREYERLVRAFDGERIGLTIFNSAPVSVFPLTRDYDYAVDQLHRIAESFDHRSGAGVPSIYSGTVFGETGSSLVGDGLASCLARLHATGDARRSSSVILATDNAVGGSPLITLPQAAGLARRDGVRVYGLDGSPRAGEGDAASVEFRDAMRHTRGAYFALADDESVTRIVREVRARQARAVPVAPRVVSRDDPGVVFAVLVGALGVVLLVGWRVRA